METIEDVLAHYGVPGMKWGVRKASSIKERRKAPKETSSDAAEAKAALVKARSKGPQSLSNKEMQALVNRMNLEQQYSKLAQANPGKMMKGADFARKLALDTGKDVAKGQTKWVANYFAKQYLAKKFNIPLDEKKKKKD